MMLQQVFWTLLILMLVHVANANIEIAFENITDVYVDEGKELDINVTLVAYSGSDSTMFFQSVNKNAFEVINPSSYNLSTDMLLPQTYGVKIRGKNFYVSSMMVLVSANESDKNTPVLEITVKILRVGNDFFDNVLRYLFFIPISINYLLMGYALDLKIVWNTLKRPLAIFIGFTCQFVLMPALAFGIGKIMELEASTALGLLLVGCCPGGKLSNDLSILVDADIMLSITMTACSTLLALGTMPLNIFIYSPLITDSNLETPYDQVAIQLASMLIPLIAGVLCRLKWPHYEKKVLKVLKPVTFVAFFVVAVVSIPFQLYLFLAPWQIFVSGLLLPLSGCILGATLAALARLPKEQIATICFETGVQNGIIAYVILRNVFPRPEADLAGRVPFICVMLMFFIGVVIFAVYNLHKRFVSGRKNEPQDDKEEIDIDIANEVSMNEGTYRSTLDSPELKDDEYEEKQQPSEQADDGKPCC